MDFGPIGIFSTRLRALEPAEYCEGAAELEELGYTTLWLTGGPTVGDVMDVIERILGATRRMVVAPAVINVWKQPAAEAAAIHARLTGAFPGRHVLGLGVSHQKFIEADGRKYDNPLGVMRSYLDALDAAQPPVPRDERLLAALAPRMLELARDRSAGSIPYLYSAEQTAAAREALGPSRTLAVELAVALVEDAAVARAIAREYMARYLDRPNYTNNLRRQGFGDSDFEHGGSDRLLDAVVAWGDLDTISARIRELQDAGADHVPLQVLAPDLMANPFEEWRILGALNG